MKWRDILDLAGLELRRRPTRAALTLLAVALAAALLSSLLSIAGTAQTRVLSQVSHGGPLATISVAPAAPDPSQAGLDNPRPGPARPLTGAALADIRALPRVRSAVSVSSVPVQLVPPAPAPKGSRLCRQEPAGRCPPVDEYQTTLVGVNLADTAGLPVSLLTGRFPSRGSPDEVDVTQDYLGRLGLGASAGPEVLGTYVELGSYQLLRADQSGQAAGAGPDGGGRDDGFFRRFALGWRWKLVEVVGVVDQQAGPGQILAWPNLAQADFAWTAAGRAAGDSDAPTSPYAGALVRADSTPDIPEVRSAISDLGYSNSAPENVIVSVSRYLHVIELVLSGIGLVALAIAALGIANALFAAVRERRRDIGVLKALGATDADVLRTFLVEAGATGFIGGLMGTAAGAAIAALIGAVANGYLRSQGLASVALSLSPGLMLATVLGATAVATAAGIVPALRAARLPAREAVDQ